MRSFGEEAGGTRSRLPFEVVRDALHERAAEVSNEAARLADGVTVARLAPGSIFPAEVVCVVGMNDGEFPRSPSSLSFDLVAAGITRRGDRDPRHEDRLAFLEALLAARRAFVVSYTGRGLRDDAALPPSVVVDELRDYLSERFPGVDFETRHPLQPFAPRYFSNPGEKTEERDAGLFSYSTGMCRAAAALLATREEDTARGRFDTVLPAPDPPRRRVSLAELVSFFAHPTRYFLRDRLGVRLEDEEGALEENEPFELDGLDRYQLRSRVWERMRAGTGAGRTEEVLRGSGRLPQRSLGRVVHERAWEDMQGLHSALAPHRTALDAPPVPIDLEIAGFRVEGEIERVGPLGLEPRRIEGHSACRNSSPQPIDPETWVWWRIGKLRARDRIAVRLRQLTLAATRGVQVPAAVITLDGDSWKTTVFPVPDEAEGELVRWLEAWRRGLTEPLPFFPETSWAYARVIARKGEDAVEEALQRAGQAWFDGYARGEMLDPYLALVYEERDPASEAFRKLANALLAPLAAA